MSQSAPSLRFRFSFDSRQEPASHTDSESEHGPISRLEARRAFLEAELGMAGRESGER